MYWIFWREFFVIINNDDGIINNRLACHMSNYRCIQIELTRGYDYAAFREDLKQLYRCAGVKGENTVFLFSDTQVLYFLRSSQNYFSIKVYCFA